MIRIYLDNCCYNRPYDDQNQLRISLETQAKLLIQELIKQKQYELASSYILDFENSENPHEMRKNAVAQFVSENATVNIGADENESIKGKADKIIETGVKMKDAYHVACAIQAECEYLLTTDDRLLKCQTDEIKIVNPVDFIRLEVEKDEF